MSEPGMEAVLASLMAEHVSDDPTTGEGDPMRYCDCGGPEDTEKPPVKRGTELKAVPLKPRIVSDLLRAKEVMDAAPPNWRAGDWFLTGSHYPTRPCLRCGSREHDDCGGGR